MNTNTHTKTAEILFGMFTENTGKHFLDSGGAYGRHWERAQGMELEDFLNAPSADWLRDWNTTVNAFTYCLNRLNYSKTAEVLTRLMNVWELNDYENRNLYSLSDQQEFLETLGAEKINGWNTYNFDNSLSQTLQGWDFELMGSRFVMLQVHGGADVRGGYTLPKIFEPHCEYWLHEADNYALNCHTCKTYWTIQGPDVFDEHGDYLGGVYPSDYFAEGCPNCKGDLQADAFGECEF